jgi:hypothetical protein
MLNKLQQLLNFFKILSSLCLLPSCSSLADRSRAFIGYSETTQGGCRDRLVNCLGLSHDNGCIYDSYKMRELCPFSCNVESCTALDPHEVKNPIMSPGTRIICSGRSDSFTIHSYIKVVFKGAANSKATMAYSLIIDSMMPTGKGHWKRSHPLQDDRGASEEDSLSSQAVIDCRSIHHLTLLCLMLPRLYVDSQLYGHIRQPYHRQRHK